MNDEQLKRRLQSVGMACFVTYFRNFGDFSLPNEDLAELIRTERGYTEKACRSRISHARSIIKAGRAKDAFAMIANAKNVKPEIREIASRMAAAQ